MVLFFCHSRSFSSSSFFFFFFIIQKLTWVLAVFVLFCFHSIEACYLASISAKKKMVFLLANPSQFASSFSFADLGHLLSLEYYV